MFAGQRDPTRQETRSEVAELYKNSRASEFGLTLGEFAAALKEFAPKQVASGLHVEDLILARGCAAGNDRAWQVFMVRFRQKLYDLARQITREDSAARELADSLYADLYGTKIREGERISKLSSYSGRGSLDGWLRTVLAQEYVNTYRKQRRLVSLDEESESGTQFSATTDDPQTPADPRLDRAVDDSLRSLSPEDRFVLASYFLDARTLAQIARSLSVHESTISRKVEKLAKNLRKQVFRNLVRQGMTRRQAEEAIKADVRDLTLDVRSSLVQDSPITAFSKKEAKATEGGR